MTNNLKLDLSALKFCKDCKHAVELKGMPLHCNVAPVFDLVNGLQPVDCHKMRYSEGACGKNAVWFEPKKDATPGVKALPHENKQQQPTSAEVKGRLTRRLKRASKKKSLIHMLLHGICGCSHDVYSDVLKWLAKPLQQPGYANEKALLCFGEQGAGKTLFFTTILQGVYGNNFALFPSWPSTEAASQPAQASLLLVADADDEKKASAKAKLILTSDKNRCGNIVLITDQTPSPDNRRVIQLHAKQPVDADVFFYAIQWEIQNGGIQRFKDDLLNLNLNDLVPSPF